MNTFPNCLHLHLCVCLDDCFLCEYKVPCGFVPAFSSFIYFIQNKYMFISQSVPLTAGLDFKAEIVFVKRWKGYQETTCLDSSALQ